MAQSSTPTLITTPFGFASTAAEVVEGIDLAGKQAIVTGGASGIGVETARALAGAGATVTLAVRRTGDGERVAADIRSSTGNDEVAVAPLELTDFASIGAFVAAWDGPLDVLVNNAGVMAIQELTLTDRGHEMQFATNHLGHFALALGLHDALAAAGNARIVSVSSSGHLRSPVIFDDLDHAFATTTRSARTGSRRRRTSSSPSRSRGAGPMTASPPTPSCPAASRPSSSATSAAPSTWSRPARGFGRREAR